MIKRIKRLKKSFTYASNGIWHALLTQPNMWVHTFSAMCTILLAWVLGFETLEWAILILVISQVMILEMVNTVAELIVDLASPDFSDMAKVAKDVAAGGVLISAAAAIGVGVFLFIPKILEIL